MIDKCLYVLSMLGMGGAIGGAVGGAMGGGHNVMPLRASDTSISSSPAHMGGGGGGGGAIGGVVGGAGGRPLYTQTATHYPSATPPR